MPKLIARAYDEDAILSQIVKMFYGPRTDENQTFRSEMRAALERELRKAVAVGTGLRISMLRDAIADIEP